MEKKQNFTIKFLLLISLLMAGVLLIAGISALLIKYSGISPEDIDIQSLVLHNPELAKWILFCQHLVLFIIVPLVFLWIFYKRGMVEELNTGSFKFKDVIHFFVLLMLVYPLMGVLTFWLSLLDLPEWMNLMDKSQEETLMTLLKMENGYDFMFNLFLLAFVPGIGEELLFRGVLQREVFKKTQKIHLSIMISSLFFAALHFQALGFTSKLCISLVLGYAYYFSGNILVPMILHMVNNGSATFAVFYSKGDIFDTQHQDIHFSWSQVVVVVLFLMLCILYYFYLEQHYKHKSNG
ncbi:MAG: CPBP family intramembrane metalloprotease [Saprospiraceae bacterium]|nr:CPBP family intramembrane metalloprotease [Saprospiraceae bacterium]